MYVLLEVLKICNSETDQNDMYSKHCLRNLLQSKLKLYSSYR